MTNQELHILGVDIKKAFDSIPMRQRNNPNERADKAANEGRKCKKPTLALPLANDLDEILILMEERIIFDKIDHRLYNSQYEEEIKNANKYTQMAIRRHRVTPKQGIVSRNQINIAMRASTNSLPTLNKWNLGNGYPFTNCKEDEITSHAIFHCKEMETIRQPIREELFNNLQQITQQPYTIIKFETITQNLKSYDPIYH